MARKPSETAAELLGIGETPAEGPEPGAPEAFDPFPYLPPNCDLVELTPEHVRRALERNHDPTVTAIIIGRVNGGRVEHLGTFAAAGATLAQVAATYGSGVYQITYKNNSGAYVGARRVHVGPDGARVGPPPMGAAGGMAPSTAGYPVIAGQRSGSPLEALALRALEQKLFGQQDDPMRGAMAETLKLMALGAESQRQAAAAAAESQRSFLEMVMKLQTFGRQQEPSSDKTVDLLTKLLLAERARPNGNGAMDHQAFMKAIELGRTLAAGGITNPSGDAAEETTDWMKLLIPAIDSMGAPAVSLLAQAFLPAEKAKFVNDAIEANLRAREAEAKADATIDATGETVP